MKLTPRESQILSFISLSVEVLGHSPTQREIARRLDVKSRTYIKRVIMRLESKGLITRENYKVRGIQVVKQELRTAT